MQHELLEQIDQLRGKIDEAWQILQLDRIRDEISALEVAANAPDLWNDPEEARTTLQKLADAKQVFERWNGLRMQLLGKSQGKPSRMLPPQFGIATALGRL